MGIILDLIHIFLFTIGICHFCYPKSIHWNEIKLFTNFIFVYWILCRRNFYPDLIVVITCWVVAVSCFFCSALESVIKLKSWEKYGRGKSNISNYYQAFDVRNLLFKKNLFWERNFFWKNFFQCISFASFWNRSYL